ncbi:GNAT family N-acetyltransferase [Candidimonas sp. SYP-B2681]|uniref:GNAT family N-acetyltransferase n=1 Tax=Candidimonas sp. SYP-B2681 TaxID=2497686 RepID=UPI000F85F031|nr:GNAT family N-acetyltransferase [Candidimonas sp. SYP-B2681]RTZ44564.1 GNAT family N-acetyltransferase [Candidimonas sp. SYP-B2681]
MPESQDKDELRPLAITLRDGRSVTIRPICPEDKDELAAAFERLCAESRYSRFFSAMRALPEKALDSATHPAPEREVALVALSNEGSRKIIIGGARYVAAPGSDTCEFAVTVADNWHALGLARSMMEMLIKIARARGVRHMEGFVLPTNANMRGLAARLGFTDAQYPEDPTLRLVTLEL